MIWLSFENGRITSYQLNFNIVSFKNVQYKSFCYWDTSVQAWVWWKPPELSVQRLLRRKAQVCTKMGSLGSEALANLVKLRIHNMGKAVNNSNRKGNSKKIYWEGEIGKERNHFHIRIFVVTCTSEFSMDVVKNAFMSFLWLLFFYKRILEKDQ